MQRQIIQIDMDNVLVDFSSAFERLPEQLLEDYKGRLDEIPGIFALMEPYPGAIDAFKRLTEKYDVYILSTAPWENPTAWCDKLTWVKRFLGDEAYKRLTLTHNKHLAIGDYLIDDRTANGAGEFTGEHIHFLTPKFPDWNSVLEYLL